MIIIDHFMNSMSSNVTLRWIRIRYLIQRVCTSRCCILKWWPWRRGGNSLECKAIWFASADLAAPPGSQWIRVIRPIRLRRPLRSSIGSQHLYSTGCFTQLFFFLILPAVFDWAFQSCFRAIFMLMALLYIEIRGFHSAQYVASLAKFRLIELKYLQRRS